MVRRWLVEDTPQGAVGREAEILEKPERVAPLSSPLAWRILQELARAPDYPNALAARLNVHEQKVYYHVRRLERAGLLEVIREESKRGASARVLAPTADAFAVVLKGRGNPVASPLLPHAGIVPRFPVRRRTRLLPRAALRGAEASPPPARHGDEGGGPGAGPSDPGRRSGREHHHDGPESTSRREFRLETGVADGFVAHEAALRGRAGRADRESPQPMESGAGRRTARRPPRGRHDGGNPRHDPIRRRRPRRIHAGGGLLPGRRGPGPGRGRTDRRRLDPRVISPRRRSRRESCPRAGHSPLRSLGWPPSPAPPGGAGGRRRLVRPPPPSRGPHRTRSEDASRVPSPPRGPPDRAPRRRTLASRGGVASMTAASSGGSRPAPAPRRFGRVAGRRCPRGCGPRAVRPSPHRGQRFPSRATSARRRRRGARSP